MPNPPAADIPSDSGILHALRLHGGEEQLRILIDQMPASIAMFDRNMRYLAVSRRWLQSHRISGNVLGKSHYEVLPEIPDHWRTLHRCCLAGEPCSLHDAELRRADGTVMWLRREYVPWATPAGDIGGMIIASEDITSQKLAELSLNQHLESIRERDERLRAILNTAHDAIITINHRGIIERLNPATEMLFGYTVDELVGKNVSILMPSPYCEAHDGYLSRYLETREPRIIGIGREAVGRRKDGSVFPVSLAVSEVDHLNLFTGIIRDLTAVKDLQRHVLEIADEERRRIGLELHDSIAQELTGTSLYVRGLSNRVVQMQESEPLPSDRSGTLSARLAEIRDIVAKLGEQLRETHQHVRELSHGMMPLPLDADGLRAVLDDLATSLTKSGVMQCVFENSQRVTNLDQLTATHIFRIAQEAVNNAVRHAQAKKIVIRWEPFDGHLLLEITDDGLGIDRRHLLPDVKTSRGLRTMQFRASLIGAQLQVETPPAGGTCVRCLLIKPTIVR